MTEIFLFILPAPIGIFLYTWYVLRKNITLHKSFEKKSTSENYGLETKFLKTTDGLKIAYWYIPVKNPKAVLILVHGYKEVNGGKNLLIDHAKYLKKAGYSTFLLDLRSFGKSQGNKVTFGINEWKDVVCAYDYLRSLPKNRNKKIGYFGVSMGAVSSIIAKGISGKGDFIIASTPFSSFKSLFNFQIKKKGYSPFIFLQPLRLAAIFDFGYNYERFSPINLIGKINVPILITSAKHDQRLPSEDAEYLFEKANNPKQFWQAETPHNIFKNNPKALQKKVLSFLSKFAQ